MTKITFLSILMISSFNLHAQWRGDSSELPCEGEACEERYMRAPAAPIPQIVRPSGPRNVNPRGDSTSAACPVGEVCEPQIISGGSDKRTVQCEISDDQRVVSCESGEYHRSPGSIDSPRMHSPGDRPSDRPRHPMPREVSRK